MADNILGRALLSTAQGSPIVIDATDTAGAYTVNTGDTGDVAIIIPGVVQASNQSSLAPLLAKDNGDGTYTLITTTE